ncbi:transcriptional regulator [Candidatus Poribacteria bacterium]|nr:transcriptional regulator [Candidatus Poribacteria bacterium]MYH82411.1 transcriptional regulator [Candidatus Poribacteria bacterium]MYK95770.1 transcriptional regulator [Candidatus Poribacteria bacterium]
MRHFTDTELLQIIEFNEADCVEFKESLSGDARKEIREAICAFANDLPNYEKPGFVFIGVRKDRTIVGLSVTDQLLLQLADMKTDGNIVPPPTLTVEKRVLEGKEVAVVKVEPSDSPPVRFKGTIHIRTGPRRDIANSQDERILTEKRRHKDAFFDIQPIPTSDISDLNLIQFEHEYLPQAFAPDILDANDRTLEEQLAVTKMIASVDEPVGTVMGILVLGKNPQDFLPGAYVQFLKIDGNDLTDEILDNEAIRGAIPDQIRRLDDKLIAHNRIAVDITSGPLEKRTALYPIEAVQQITRNAIMHRTYEATNAPVHVYWYKDRIEVLSPGGAFGSVTAANFGNPRFADYRNPNLAEAMRTLGYVQRFGVGISIARRLLQESGHPELEFEVVDNHVLATIIGVQQPERT